MPTRYTKGSELEQFQYEIANEIRRDAKPIATGVFGNNARHPDMASLSNAEVDRLYREAYLREDRKFLQQEAQRDPQQFLAVTDRIGVGDPPVDPQGKPIPPQANQEALANTLQQQALQNAAQAAPSPFAPTVPAALPPPVAAPVAPPVLPVAAPVAPPAQMPLPGMT
jgi:hypothetical protein